MTDTTAHLLALAGRAVLVLVVFGIGWLVMLKGVSLGSLASLGYLLIGMGLFLAAAIILAPPLAKLIAEPSGSLFFSGERFDRPQPVYSIPESKRKKGLSREAFDGYRHIMEEYPQDARAYVQMIDIAIVDLKDLALAQWVLERGYENLKKKEVRDGLFQYFAALRSGIDSPSSQTPHAITLNKDRAGPATLPNSEVAPDASSGPMS